MNIAKKPKNVKEPGWMSIACPGELQHLSGQLNELLSVLYEGMLTGGIGASSQKIMLGLAFDLSTKCLSMTDSMTAVSEVH